MLSEILGTLYLPPLVCNAAVRFVGELVEMIGDFVGLMAITLGSIIYFYKSGII